MGLLLLVLVLLVFLLFDFVFYCSELEMTVSELVWMKNKITNNNWGNRNTQHESIRTSQNQHERMHRISTNARHTPQPIVWGER